MNAHLKTIIDRQKLMELNAEGCPACGHKFNLGDPVVIACGSWEGPPRLIHESEAVFDPRSSSYVERRCFQAKMK
ncbi:MAG: hypothetical protein ACOZF0_11085 [Thermodesulfobacteriota bacterium]